MAKSNVIGGNAKSIVLSIVGVIVLVYVIVAIIPDLLASFTALGAVQGMPLASLFTNGVMGLVVVAYLVYAIFNQVSNVAK